MSDLPFQLPISEGTGEPFGQVTRQPPKFTIRGVSLDSPEGRAAVQKWQGAIRQFYQQQQQDRSLSVVNFYQAEANLAPGVHITYVRNYNQETVTLDIQAEGGAKAQGGTTPGFYDWALIEIECTQLNGTDTNYELAAFLTQNLKGKVVYAHDNNVDNSSDKTLRFADVEQSEVMNPVIVIDDNAQRSSLLVDLRPFQTEGNVVSIDLYGFVYPYDTDEPPTDPSIKYVITGSGTSYRRVRYWRDTAGNYKIYTDAATFAKLMRVFPEYDGSTTIGVATTINGFSYTSNGVFGIGAAWNHDWGGGFNFPSEWSDNTTLYTGSTNPVVVADPDTIMSTFAATYGVTNTDWPGTAYVRVTQYVGVQWTDPTGTPNHTNNVLSMPFVNGQYTITGYDYQLLYLPSVSVYQPMKATIRAALFKGNPFDACDAHLVNGFQGFYQWQQSSKYPARPGLGTEPVQATFPSQDYPSDDSLANKFGLPKIGTIRLGPSEKNAGFNFKPA